MSTHGSTRVHLETVTETVRTRAGMRQRLVRLDERRVLVSRLIGSQESQDSYTDVNCGGFGRVRKFTKFSMHLRSPQSVLERKPHLRGLPGALPFTTQVFQIGGCNWACWYCFVDDELLDGNASRGAFLTASELIDLYELEPEESRPAVIDLSGGQPDLVPEWCVWVMEELDKRGLRERVHVWIDDNLSGNFMRTFLSREQIAYMAQYPKHSRVGCIKGFDRDSFQYNTGANPTQFERQFEILGQLLEDGFDLYTYATFTAPGVEDVSASMSRFVDLLQDVHPNLPLRTIPLEIRQYSATERRVGNGAAAAISFQYEAAEAWESELFRRFSADELLLPYEDVSMEPL